MVRRFPRPWTLAGLCLVVLRFPSADMVTAAEAAQLATPKVDFSYAFATPHRITVGRPDSSDRTLLDLQPGSLRMAWTYEDLSRPATYGLMPPGMGDAGLMNDGDLYGVFLPHNIWAVYADRLAVKAAKILGRTADLAELQKIYETARDDLLQAIRRGAIQADGYRAHLARGNGDAAARYLYATLNHGTPLYTWCEERGQEPGTSKCSGDRQHLWTPVAVVRAIRDSLVWEEGDGLRLALGTDRSWLAGGKPVGIADAPTHFGRVSYQLQYDSAKAQVTGRARFPENATATWAELLVRLPSGLRLMAINPDSGAALLPAGQGLRWETPRKTFEFVAQVGN